MTTETPTHGYGGQTPADDTIHLGEIVQILARQHRLVGVVTLVVTLLTILWVGTRTPQYKASATLLLEQDEATGGVLSELASLTADPAAEAEIALIRSRSLAAVTAAPPSSRTLNPVLFDETAADFDPVAAGDTTSMEGMGLNTIVDAFDLRPARGMVRRIWGEKPESHRLRAWMAPAPGHEDDPDLAPALDVHFVDEGTVRVAIHGGYLLADSYGGALHEDWVERSYTPNEAFEVFNQTLRLRAIGAFAGQTYRVKRHSEATAVERLMERTSASESGRKTNVVNVKVEDSCPYRAAETANALAKNYIRRSVQIGRLKAERTLGFIRRQLLEQLDSLEQAEKRVADLQSANPQTISLTDSAKAIIDQIAALELQSTQLDLARTVLNQALGLLDRGDYEGLARLGKETPNLLALGYIQELSILEAESLRLDRTDVQGYKQLLQAEHLRLRALVDETSLTIQTYELALKAIAAGDSAAVARLALAPKTVTPGNGPSEFESYLKSLAELDGEIARASAELMPGNPVLETLSASRSALVVTITAQAEASLAGARSTRSGYERLLADYSTSIDSWPTNERGTIDRAVGTLRQRVRASLTSQVNGLADQVSAVDEKIREQDQRLGDLPQSQLTLAQATRDLSTHSEIVAFLLKSEQEAQITAAATSAAAVLIDPAQPPHTRSFPRATIFIALGIVLGLLLGCALGLVSNAMRAALHTEADVERVSGLPVLGAVPDFTRGRTRISGVRKAQRALPILIAPDGPQAEAYRSIRASLRHAMHGEDALKTLACTSCTKGEGKTVTNADLAIVFAKVGRKILLVDGDLRKAQLHTLFSISRGPGFADVLEDGKDWRECVQSVGIDNLSVLPAGRPTHHSGELLAGERALDLVDEFKESYDLVVFDLPPAIVVADVANFASNLDALLLIYRSGVVPGRVLSGAVNRLRRADVKLLGVILNAVYTGRVVGAYGGEYGYGYGYGYSDGEQPS